MGKAVGGPPRRSVRRYVRTWEGPTNAAHGPRSRSPRYFRNSRSQARRMPDGFFGAA